MEDKELIKKLVEKYRYDRKIRRFSNKHYLKDSHRIHREVNTNKDVEIAENHIKSRIESLKKIYPLVSEDIEDLEKAVARFEIAVCKVIQCFDNHYTDFNYNAKELEELINKVFEYQKACDEVAQRKLFQD
jgi:DNA repair ATPase RecN